MYCSSPADEPLEKQEQVTADEQENGQAGGSEDQEGGDAVKEGKKADPVAEKRSYEGAERRDSRERDRDRKSDR